MDMNLYNINKYLYQDNLILNNNIYDKFKTDELNNKF